MPVRKSQQKNVNKYISRHYDRINLTVPKGKKQYIQEKANSVEESTNTFINKAINERIEKLFGCEDDTDGG